MATAHVHFVTSSVSFQMAWVTSLDRTESKSTVQSVKRCTYPKDRTDWMEHILGLHWPIYSCKPTRKWLYSLQKCINLSQLCLASKLLERGDPSTLSLPWVKSQRPETAKGSLRLISQKETKRLTLKTNNNDKLSREAKARAARAGIAERVNMRRTNLNNSD